MKNFRMTIQYDGSRYSGWQKQGNTQNTIQGKIEDVLEKLTNEEIEIHGSGRTDAGVHALGQVANFKCNASLSETELMDVLNSYLPLDIRVINLKEAEPRFHARLNAKKKQYRYTINTNTVHDVFNRKYQYHLPEALNLEAMQEAIFYLQGEHDFKSFCDNKRMKKSTVRTIYEIKLTLENGILTIDYLGNGFLYHMVRILTGTLIEVGQGKRGPEEIPDIIRAKDRSASGFLAPAEGLTLIKVEY